MNSDPVFLYVRIWIRVFFFLDIRMRGVFTRIRNITLQMADALGSHGDRRLPQQPAAAQPRLQVRQW